MNDLTDLGTPEIRSVTCIKEYHHSAVTEFVSQFDGGQLSDEGGEMLQAVQRVYDQVSLTLNPSAELEQRLKALHIKVPNKPEVKGDTGSSRLTERDLSQIYGESLKKSRFTRHEIQTICMNWNKFTAKYGLDNPMFFANMRSSRVSMMVGSRNMLRFKRYLAQGLPGRSLFSVFRTWLSQFCSQVKQRFTEAETRLLHMLDKLSKEKRDGRLKRMNTLALALQRQKKAINMKLKELTKPQPLELVNWSLDREQELVREVVKATNASCVEDLQELRSKVLWRGVSEEMALPNRQAYDRWHYHVAPALLSTRWRKRLHLQTDLIRRLQKKIKKGRLTDWREVDWAHLAKQVGGYGSLYVYRVVMSLRWNLVKDKETRSNMSKSIEKLEQYLLQRIDATSLQLPRPVFQASDGPCLRRAKYNFKTRRLKNILPPWHCKRDDMEEDDEEELPDDEEMSDEIHEQPTTSPSKHKSRHCKQNDVAEDNELSSMKEDLPVDEDMSEPATEKRHKPTSPSKHKSRRCKQNDVGKYDELSSMKEELPDDEEMSEPTTKKRHKLTSPSKHKSSCKQNDVGEDDKLSSMKEELADDEEMSEPKTEKRHKTTSPSKHKSRRYKQNDVGEDKLSSIKEEHPDDEEMPKPTAVKRHKPTNSPSKHKLRPCKENDVGEDDKLSSMKEELPDEEEMSESTIDSYRHTTSSSNHKSRRVKS